MAEKSYAQRKLRFNVYGEGELTYSIWGPWEMVDGGEIRRFWLCRAPGFPEVLPTAQIDKFFESAVKSCEEQEVVRVRATTTDFGIWHDSQLRKVEDKWVASLDGAPIAIEESLEELLRVLWKKGEDSLDDPTTNNNDVGPPGGAVPRPTL